MNSELIEALNILEREKDINKEVLLEAIENSLETAYKSHFDKADNVSGVEGVGRVTAIDLLKYYDNFVSIFDNIDEVCHKDIGIGKKAWSNLVNIKIGDDPIIDLNMKLITIVDDIDVGNEFKTDENEVEFINVVEILKEMELEVPMNFKRFYGRH